MLNIIVPRSNSIVSKTQQRPKTDKEVNGTTLAKGKGQFCESFDMAVERKILRMTCGSLQGQRTRNWQVWTRAIPTNLIKLTKEEQNHLINASANL